MADGSLRLSAWRGSTAPALPLRAAYFATHFHNWYHAAPVQDVCDYIEELALWGFNHLFVWFDKHHFTHLGDPSAQQMLDRLRGYARCARSLGMKVGIVVCANEAYADSPRHLRTPKTWGNFGCELCPSKPEGLKLTLRWFDEQFHAMADIGVDSVCIWPYDQGGCSCDDCWMWGTNGFLKLAEPIARMSRSIFGNTTIILSTWLFDGYIKKNLGNRSGYTPGDEWRSLLERFSDRPDWVDRVMIDAHYVGKEHLAACGATPGNLPLVDFPEVSMRGMFPWGGFGANPLPGLFPIWPDRRFPYHGGLIYSEGLYEDVNKVIHAQAYWDPARAPTETVREYASYEFAPQVADDAVRLAQLFEQAHYRAHALVDGRARFTIKNPQHVEQAHQLASHMDAALPAGARNRWRWRLWRLRAVIDHELVKHGGFVNDTCSAAMEELTRLYHASDRTPFTLQPPCHAAVESVVRRYGQLWPWDNVA